MPTLQSLRRGCERFREGALLAATLRAPPMDGSLPSRPRQFLNSFLIFDAHLSRRGLAWLTLGWR